ncbi:AbrB/MazE/SpoVT family DNA-binding domain-containing protein [Staphylococcus agnetis]|uniref:AbrB/MazE/SpoVT family DNA-binding domain-containing protein n=1 Tax=Staphylococcus agnetis TaxID=985762 RepID=UPI00208FB6E2|nr:AbrB/MazE/SpoVT family DNA-binding domain-containing protein [Staphylococcus agnetis]MCO4346541.1 AbrB/MazE/SpoVT family DNA-binding domain-containing protein [Staphylococcus agnetis]
MVKIQSKIIRNGNSQALTLSKYMMEKSGLKLGDYLDYYVKNGKIIFEKSKEGQFEQNFKEFFENGGTYEEYKVDVDQPTGREIW